MSESPPSDRMSRRSSTLTADMGDTRSRTVSIAGSETFTTTTGVRVRQRSATRFEAKKRDVTLGRFSRFRSISTLPTVAVDADVIHDVATQMPTNAELRFCDYLADQTAVVALSKDSCVVLSKKRSGFSSQLSTQLGEITGVFDSAIDEQAVFIRTKTPVTLSQHDIEARLLRFSSKEARESFLAHLFNVINPGLLQNPTEGLGHVGVQLVTWDTILSSANDVLRNLEVESRKAGATAGSLQEDKVEGTENDFLQVAETREAFCSKLKANGDLRILFSSEVNLADNSHDIVVLTESSLYIGKQKKEAVVRYRVQYSAIESVLVDTSNAQLVLVKLDFSNVTIRGDMALTFGSGARYRDIFLSILCQAYEAVQVDRLKVEHESNIFWAKRGFVESQLLRVVNAIKTSRFTRALGGGNNDNKDSLTDEQKSNAKWLLYCIQANTIDFFAAVTRADLPCDDLDFVARSITTLFLQADAELQLIRRCCEYAVQAALHLVEKKTIETKEAHEQAGRHAQDEFEVTIFSNPASLARAILLHSVANCGDTYVQSVLGQPVEIFLNDFESHEPLSTDKCCEWVGKFLKPIFDHKEGELMASEIKTVIAMLAECWSKVQLRKEEQAKDTSTRSLPYIGSFIFQKLFTCLCNPAASGLWSSELSDEQLLNLQSVSGILRCIFNFSTLSIFSETDAPPICRGLPMKEKHYLAHYARSNFDLMKDFLKAFIFPDLIKGSEVEPAYFAKAFSGDEDDHSAYDLHIATMVNLDCVNPKLLLAIQRSLSPYFGRMIAVSVGHGSRSDRKRQELQLSISNAHKGRVRFEGEPKEQAPDVADDAPELTSRKRGMSTLEASVQQLTHEVFVLREQLQAAQDGEKSAKIYAAQLACLIATMQSEMGQRSNRRPTSPRPSSPVSRHVSQDRRVHFSDSSENSSSDDERSSPTSPRATAPGSPRSNPLTNNRIGGAGVGAGSESPAAAMYRKERQREVVAGESPERAGAEKVFGCPLDTYYIPPPPVISRLPSVASPKFPR